MNEEEMAALLDTLAWDANGGILPHDEHPFGEYDLEQWTWQAPESAWSNYLLGAARANGGTA